MSKHNRKVMAMDYTGLSCDVCQEKFKAEDDVVVCPDCGTPMHRSCYKELRENGVSCPNENKHKDGFVYEGFETIKRSAQGAADHRSDDSTDVIRLDNVHTASGDRRVCPVCGGLNRQGANFCDNCGTRLAIPQLKLTSTLNEDSEGDFSDPKFFASYAIGQNSHVPAGAAYEDDVTAGDVACYVAVNTSYYLRAFKLIKNGSGKFNLSAAIFSGVWFFYRKLYKMGGLMISIQALLYALKVYFTRNVSLTVMKKLLATIGVTVNEMPSLTFDQYMQLSAEMQKLSTQEQFIMMMPTLILILQIAVMIVCGVIANKMYYKKCLSGIRAVKSVAEKEALSRAETSQSLYLSGGVNSLLAGILGFFYVFLLFM